MGLLVLPVMPISGYPLFGMPGALWIYAARRRDAENRLTRTDDLVFRFAEELAWRFAMKQSRGDRITRWAGWILTVEGGGHFAAGLLILSPPYFGDWLSFGLWGHWWEDTDSANTFWGNMGGFGWPLLLVGLLVVWMNRRGIVPPKFLAWMVLGWGTAMTYIVQPTPGLGVVIAGLLLLRAIRRAGETGPVRKSPVSAQELAEKTG